MRDSSHLLNSLHRTAASSHTSGISQSAQLSHGCTNADSLRNYLLELRQRERLASAIPRWPVCAQPKEIQNVVVEEVKCFAVSIV